MSEEVTKKGIMLAYAEGTKFSDLENNDKVKAVFRKIRYSR